jgi:hypothetical protein
MLRLLDALEGYQLIRELFRQRPPADLQPADDRRTALAPT